MHCAFWSAAIVVTVIGTEFSLLIDTVVQPMYLSRILFSGCCLVVCLLSGCNGTSNVDKNATAQSEPTSATNSAGNITQPPVAAETPKEFVVNAEQLLKAALPEDQLKEGWVSLFDGQSLFGWFIVDKANWRVEDGVIKVDNGEKSFLCSSIKIADYELQVDFRGDTKTNSGIFLRTLPSPGNVAEECLELNIAPPENPFPTGSFVQRKKLEPSELGNFDPTQWHTYHVRLEGDQVTVQLDGKKILEYLDDSALRAGHISLQHNEGRAEFRNVRLRPMQGKSLKLSKDWQEDWTESHKEGAEFKVTNNAEGLSLTGGLGQLQSKSDYGDFMLQATYKLAKPEVNSGIFFRCIRETILDGYECQLNHAIVEEDPLRPADAGAGAIFRRQPARVVVGNGSTPTYISLFASGPQMLTWVNGIQVVDFVDTRPVDANPRKGLRTEPGPIALQGHDPTTDVTFTSIKITELKP
jgi:Domain of Unknown Function (DUF1080)